MTARSTRSMFSCAMLALLPMAGPFGLHAQLHAQGSQPPRPGGYAQYWTGACVEAIERSHNFYWRARFDTAAFAVATDTTLTDERTVARDCLAHVAPDSALPTYALIPLLRARLVAGDEAGAARAARTRLMAPDVRREGRSDGKAMGARAWILAQIVDAFLDVKPAHVSAARAYLLQLDALQGSAAAVAKVRGWLRLAQYYRYANDDSSMIHAAQSAIRSGKLLSPHGRNDLAPLLLAAYEWIAQARGDGAGTAAPARAVIAGAKRDLGALAGMSAALAGDDSLFSLYGTHGARIAAGAWIGESSGDSIHPRIGRPSILVFQVDRQTAAVMRRVVRVLGDSVDVAFIQTLSGYFRDLGPLSPAEEIRQLRPYLLKELNVSSPVAVVEPDVQTLPDGRRVSKPTTNDTAYMTQAGTAIVLLDRRGIIRRVWRSWDRWCEPGLWEALERYR